MFFPGLVKGPPHANAGCTKIPEFSQLPRPAVFVVVVLRKVKNASEPRLENKLKVLGYSGKTVNACCLSALNCFEMITCVLYFKSCFATMVI